MAFMFRNLLDMFGSNPHEWLINVEYLYAVSSTDFAE